MQRPSRATLVGLAAGVAAWLVFEASGQQRGFHDALVEMGFDPDRAELLTALAVGALAAAAGALATGRRRIEALLGTIATLVAFRTAFVAETKAALGSSGSQGVFSPAGWLLTAATLLIAAAVVASASATLAREVRRGLAAIWRPAVRAATVSSDRARRVAALARPTAISAAALVALVVAVSVFGDMVNYSPDADMRTGGPAGVPLAGNQGGSEEPTPSIAGSAAEGSTAGAGAADTTGTGAGSAALTSAIRPWLGWVPSGSGRVDHLTFPAPWTDGRSTSADVWVYVPAGYDGSSRRYPVTYEAPWTVNSWQRGVRISQTLDDLIASGRIPAQLMVFVGQGGGPYIWSECVDSFDGRERFESYVVSTVVPAIDARYRTIATPSARSVIGFSDGGFCSTMLTLRHPDVFGSAIAFSGYFVAGLRANQTANAWRPFGNDPQLIASHSPILLASRVPKAARDRLYVVLVGQPTEPLYGPQMTRFEQALEDAAIPSQVIADQIGHSWIEVRDNLAAALADVAARQVSMGVFGG